MYYVKTCVVCERTFPTKSKRKGVCSDACHAIFIKRKRREHETLCWDCQNATKCSWKDGIPVKGWNAEPRMVNDKEGIIRTYRVIDCPKFLEDEIRSVSI